MIQASMDSVDLIDSVDCMDSGGHRMFNPCIKMNHKALKYTVRLGASSMANGWEPGGKGTWGEKIWCEYSDRPSFMSSK